MKLLFKRKNSILSTGCTFLTLLEKLCITWEFPCPRAPPPFRSLFCRDRKYFLCVNVALQLDLLPFSELMNLGVFVKAIIHLPLAHLPRSNMAHLPGKWHICPVTFDTFALTVAHLPRSKRAHLPRQQNNYVYLC